MSFAVSANAYDRFMGRYSTPLAPVFADYAGVVRGQRVIDVGCGPGALTAELLRRVAPADVAAVDPSESFVEAMNERFPTLDVRRATAELLPFDAGTFDVAIAQLVVHFMTDPVAGLAEMARVTRPGGTVAACVWDYHSGTGPLCVFWDAARRLDPSADDERALAGGREGQIDELMHAAGLTDIEGGAVSVQVRHVSFDEWWEPFTLGVGPAGKFVAALDDEGRRELRDICLELQPQAPFTVTASAWAAKGRAQ